ADLLADGAQRVQPLRIPLEPGLAQPRRRGAALFAMAGRLWAAARNGDPRRLTGALAAADRHLVGLGSRLALGRAGPRRCAGPAADLELGQETLAHAGDRRPRCGLR